MKTLCIICSVLFGVWFWRRPAPTGHTAWPEAMPVFAPGTPTCAYTLKNGSSFVCTTILGGRDEALARVRAAFAESGWSLAPIHTRDMLVFMRGDAVAAVLAEEVAAGTRLTALQRPKGL